VRDQHIADPFRTAEEVDALGTEREIRNIAVARQTSDEGKPIPLQFE
jgi:hypothetical protein